MDATMLRLLCGALALLFGAVILMRRRSHKAE
jgi:hypothetical protein